MIDPTSLPEMNAQDLAVLPIERSETMPSSWYIHPKFHEIDHEIIFSRTWQFVGHLSFVKHRGDYFLATVADNPLMVIRGADNIVRAFFNVCRHRGGPLAINPSGNCSFIQCKYHGWTYLQDGSLRGTPKFDRTELFDRKDFGLISVRSETWNDLIFVNLSPDPPSLEETMRGIADRIAPNTVALKSYFKRVSYDVNAHWKVYVDNYLEGYHLPFVHPELCSLLDFQNYRTEVFEHYSLQHSPISGNEKMYGSMEGEAFYYFIFPNFMLNILPGRLQSNCVVPLTHNTCRVIFDYYYDDISSPEAKKMIEADMTYSDRIQQEDIEICEHVQKGLESIAYDKGRFSPEMEEGVYHFQSLLKKRYASMINHQAGEEPGTTPRHF